MHRQAVSFEEFIRVTDGPTIHRIEDTLRILRIGDTPESRRGD